MLSTRCLKYMPFRQHLIIFAAMLAGCMAAVPKSMRDCTTAWESLAPTASATTSEDKLTKSKGHFVQLFAPGEAVESTRIDPSIARRNRVSFWGLFICENNALKHVACRFGDSEDKKRQLILPVGRWYWNGGRDGEEGKADFFAYACREEGPTPTFGKWNSVVADGDHRGAGFKGMHAGDNKCERAADSIWCGVSKEMLDCKDEWLQITRSRRTHDVDRSAIETMAAPQTLSAEFQCKEKKVDLKQCRIGFFDKPIPIGQYYLHYDYHYNCGQLTELAGDYSMAISITASPVKRLKRQAPEGVLERVDKIMEGCRNEWVGYLAHNGGQRESTVNGAIQFVKAILSPDGNGFSHRSLWVELECTMQHALKQKFCLFGHAGSTEKIAPGRCKFVGGWTFRCGRFQTCGEVEKHVTVTQTTDEDKKECEPVQT